MSLLSHSSTQSYVPVHPACVSICHSVTTAVEGWFQESSLVSIWKKRWKWKCARSDLRVRSDCLSKQGQQNITCRPCELCGKLHVVLYTHALTLFSGCMHGLYRYTRTVAARACTHTPPPSVAPCCFLLFGAGLKSSTRQPLESE